MRSSSSTLLNTPTPQALAQRACTAYLRSVHLQPDKGVFDAAVLPVAEYAASLGLSALPRLRFLKRGAGRHGAAAPGDEDDEDEASSSDEEGAAAGPGAAGAPTAPRREPTDGEASRRAAAEDGDDSGDDFLVVKQRRGEEAEEAEEVEEAGPGPGAVPPPGRAKKKKPLRIRADKPTGSRVVFDDAGEARDALELLVPEGAE